MWDCAAPRRAAGGDHRLFGTLGAADNLDSFAAEIRSRPPVLLVHGDQDDLIPAQALFQAAQGLAALGVPAEWHLSAGVGHGIDPEGLRHGGEFLARGFAANH
jgi:phospholipase/carboxylesterase